MTDRTAETVPMDPETLEALKGSIAKWEAIVAGTGADHGAADCSLCIAFPDNYCKGCPVSSQTGRRGCRGTPFDDWADLEEPDVVISKDDKKAVSQRAKDIAQREVDFLKSLLPRQAP